MWSLTSNYKLRCPCVHTMENINVLECNRLLRYYSSCPDTTLSYIQILVFDDPNCNLNLSHTIPKELTIGHAQCKPKF